MAEANGALAGRRARQNGAWLERLISEGLERRFRADPRVAALLPELESQVLAGSISPRAAAARVLGAATDRG
jgi:LAO/AO transport system kinase